MSGALPTRLGIRACITSHFRMLVHPKNDTEIKQMDHLSSRGGVQATIRLNS